MSTVLLSIRVYALTSGSLVSVAATIPFGLATLGSEIVSQKKKIP